MTGKTKYKRKFLVPGDTPKGKDWNQRFQMCADLCGPIYTSMGKINLDRVKLKCSINRRPWSERDYSKCIFPEKIFNYYIVSELETGPWQCSCKGWIFKYRKLHQDCDHIREAKAHPKKYQIPIETTTGTIRTFKELLG